MILAHHVTLELFIKERPAFHDPERLLDTLAPLPLATIREHQWRWHPTRVRTKVYEVRKRGVSLWESVTRGEEGPIRILRYRFTKWRDVKPFLQRLKKELPREERELLVKELPRHLDGEGRFHLRLDAGALQEGRLRLARGACVACTINLAAYPKRWSACAVIAKSLLGEE